MVTVYVIVCMLLICGLVMASVRLDSVRFHRDLPPLRDYSGSVASTRRRIMLSIFLTALAVGVPLLTNRLIPEAYGLPLALLPAFAMLAGIASFEVYPSPVLAKPALRTASLKPRGTLRFVSPVELLVFASAALATVACLVALGFSASPDSQGLSRMIARSDVYGAGEASPYPGWYYGGPLIVATVLLVVCSLVALRRIAMAPAFPDPQYSQVDQIWRQVVSKMVVRSAMAAMLCYAIGVLFYAGMATHNVAARPGAAGMVVHMDDIALSGLELGAAAVLVVVVIFVVGSLVVAFGHLDGADATHGVEA